MNSKQHFFNELKKYSNNENQIEKEWIQISKHKKESPCICGHVIHHYAYVYNIENGHILTIGVGCCKKYGITQFLNNNLLLEFFTESGSLFYKNGFFDINRDIDFIKFLNNKLEGIQKIEKENLGEDIKFYLRQIEILKKNLEELIDKYHFYCGQNLLLKTNELLEILEDYSVQYDVEDKIASQPTTPIETENTSYEHSVTNDDSHIDLCKEIVNEIINNVEDIPTEIIEHSNDVLPNDVSTVAFVCEKCGGVSQSKKYNFTNPNINEMLLQADKALEQSPKITMEMKAVIETANYHADETTQRLRRIRLGLREIRLGFEELNKNIYKYYTDQKEK